MLQYTTNKIGLESNLIVTGSGKIAGVAGMFRAATGEITLRLFRMAYALFEAKMLRFEIRFSFQDTMLRIITDFKHEYNRLRKN